MEWLNNLFSGDQKLSLDEQWIVAGKVFIVVIAALLLNFILQKFVDRIKKKTDKSNNLWDDAFIYAIRKPLRLLIWALGIILAAEIAFDGSKGSLSGALLTAREIVIIISITWFTLRFVKFSEKNIILQKYRAPGLMKVERSTAHAIAKLLRIAIFITAVLITMQTLGLSVGGVLAFGGIGGMAVGFAAKDMLANFFGALSIYFDRPFSVGDWIRSPDREIEGTVEEIGWRQTRIRTFDQRPLYVPNSVFTTIAVQNPSRMTHRRIYETIGVRYDDMSSVSAIVKDVENMIKSHSEIAQDEIIMVALNEFADSSVNFFIYCMTITKDWIKYHGVKQDVMLKISDIIDSYGAEIAFPTRTLHVESDMSALLQEKIASSKGNQSKSS